MLIRFVRCVERRNFDADRRLLTLDRLFMVIFSCLLNGRGPQVGAS